MSEHDLSLHGTEPHACAHDCALAGASIGEPLVDRRTFISRAALAAAALALAACGDALTTAPASVSGTINVNDYSALSATNGVALVTVSGAQLAIVRTSASSFVALSRVCPHQGATVNYSGSNFVCPRHGATFNRTGAWIGGQQTSSLRSYPTTYDSTTGVLTIG